MGARGCGGSNIATRDKPDAVEREVCLLADQIVVGVVVQDPERVDIGDSGDQDIHRRETMMPDARQLPLSIERATLNVTVDRDQREGQQLVEHIDMVGSIPSGVASLE